MIDLEDWDEKTLAPALEPLIKEQEKQPDAAAAPKAEKPVNDKQNDDDDADSSEESHNERESEQNIFSLEDLEKQFRFIGNNVIKQFEAANDCFLIVTETKDKDVVWLAWIEDGRMLRNQYSIVRKTSGEVYRAFLDPMGIHALVACVSGDNYYINRLHHANNEKLKPIPRMKVKVCSVAWNKRNKSETTTGAILLGDANAAIYRIKLDLKTEPACRLLHDLGRVRDESLPIVALEFEWFPMMPDDYYHVTKLVIFACTPVSMYQFIGGPDFESLFAEYITEWVVDNVNGAISHSELQLFRKPSKKKINLPEAFAWITASGIKHGKIEFSNQVALESVVTESEIISYDSKALVSVGVTEYHTIVLLTDRIHFLMKPPALCKIQPKAASGRYEYTPKLIYERIFENEGEPKGIVRDIRTGNIYVYTDETVLQIDVESETQDVWRLYVERAINPEGGNHKSYFDKALSLIKTDALKREQVLSAQADYYFSKGMYIESAHVYAKIRSRSFEEVVSRFLSIGNRAALMRFMGIKIEELAKQLENKPIKSMQLSGLCAYYLEQMLHELNTATDTSQQLAIAMQFDRMGDVSAAYKAAESQVAELTTHCKNFLSAYTDHLHRKTTLRMLRSHGHTELFAYYAMAVKDYNQLIHNYIVQKQFDDALQILQKHCTSVTYCEEYYRHSPVLIRHRPLGLVTALLRAPFLDPLRLLPALSLYVHSNNNQSLEHQGIRYLKWCIGTLGNKSRAVHHLMIEFMAQQHSERDLIAFLNFDSELRVYDLGFAVRMCIRYQKHETLALLYSALGRHEDAVSLALKIRNTDLAAVCAEKPESDDEKRKLWFQIERFIVEDELDVGKALIYLSQTNAIKLDDVLPLFPDDIEIDRFKEGIGSSLVAYQSEIEEMQQEMDDATLNSNMSYIEKGELRHRSQMVSSTTSKCELCGHSIMFSVKKTAVRDYFFVFPCGHRFHADCLLDEKKPFLDTSTASLAAALLRRLAQPNSGRSVGVSGEDDSSGSNSANSSSGLVGLSLSLFTSSNSNAEKEADPMGTSAATAAVSGAASVEDDKRQVDEILGGSCVLCGEHMIDSVSQPFTDTLHNQDNDDKASIGADARNAIHSWDLN